MSGQMYGHEELRPPRSAAVTAVGVDHVRLSYHYLDIGDAEGYGSLLDDDIELRHPGSPRGFGRAEVLRAYDAAGRPPGRRDVHRIHRIVAEGDHVVALGRLIRRPGLREDLDFADHFTLSPEGMLLSCRRYYCTPPG
jgi:ketosteroid isomerase-like protein